MVIKKEARLAQSLELLVHGNKPALERDCRAFVFTTLLQFAVLFSESLTHVLFGKFVGYFLFKGRKHNFPWMSDFSY